MIILGINSHHPDSSAALLADGRLVAAAEEERFTRVKHFAGFPGQSIKYCLKEAGISIKDVDYLAIPRKPEARIIKKCVYGLSAPLLAKDRLSSWGRIFDVKKRLAEITDSGEKDISAKIVKVEHHISHLASSFFVSGFDKAFLFSADALGDFASTMWGIGEGNRVKALDEITFPHSLGFYYTAITQYLGFTDFGDEYKVMGLAAYGEPVFEDEFEKIIKIRGTGFELGLEYFLHHKKHANMFFKDGHPELDMIFSPYLEKRLGKRRLPGEPLEKRHKDIASSLQKALEKIIIHLLSFNSSKYSNLCMAGGVSFNCAANGRISDLNLFKNIYVPPAAGDAGLAVGAGFYVWNHVLGRPGNFTMDRASLGPGFSPAELKTEIEKNRKRLADEKYAVETMTDEDSLCRKAAQYIADGKVVGWFQGRMEFGPRSLGNRSILADPRRPEMKNIINDRIKHRESFRPFAPSILEEDLNEFFDTARVSPFMSFVCRIKGGKIKYIPAVAHVDGTARVQTVNSEANAKYWKLINTFKRVTGIPVLLNTSFNDNEPIVCTPEEAINCLLRTRMDVLALGDTLIYR